MHAPSSPPPQRFDLLDALRGLAMVWMTVFHFVFDLNHFQFVRQDFYGDPLWTTQRTVILSLFLFCAGMGQSVAVQQGQGWPRFWRRWGQIAGCALLVTLGSYMMYPRSFIYFGVLHGMALMLLVARLTAHWGGGLWLAGAGAIALRFLGADALQATGWAEAFNGPALNWLGVVTRKPITEDYVPLLPWLAPVWWGVAAGHLLQRHGGAWLSWHPGGPPGRLLAWLGRWSLSYYMLHQPVMIGALLAWGLVVR